MTEGHQDYGVFIHLNAEYGERYRAILRVFATRRAHFVISLRPGEVLEELHRTEPQLGLDESAIETALQQLKAWGNLDDTPDQIDAATIEEFYRNRRLYQLSAAGEAAEAALARFEEFLRRPGELQTTALHDIVELLDALLPRLADAPPDDAKLHQILESLALRFEQLTTRAQAFMRELQSTVELHGITVDDFLAYKEKLIEYLEKFIGELVLAASRIGDRIENLESCGVENAFAAAARRELANALTPAPDEQSRLETAWRERWEGFRRWFIGDGQASQAELLRARARSAIPALLTAVSQINDRRASRADRAADFQALARWFVECESEADCHRLWRAAFALSPARHLRINSETLLDRTMRNDETGVSWLDAVPIWLSPRLRQHGRSAPRGPGSPTIDRSAEKARLREFAREQAAQIQRARSQLLGFGRKRLSSLEPFDEPAFRLFLELLGHALAQRPDRRGPIDVESADGTLRIRLEPTADGAKAALRTPIGLFSGEDHWLEITSMRSVRRPRFAA